MIIFLNSQMCVPKYAWFYLLLAFDCCIPKYQTPSKKLETNKNDRSLLKLTVGKILILGLGLGTYPHVKPKIYSKFDSYLSYFFSCGFSCLLSTFYTKLYYYYLVFNIQATNAILVAATLKNIP